MDRPLDILAVDPWHAGSHKDFLDGLAARSRHNVTPLTLPGRFWKWRQTGSGMVLAQKALAAFPDTPPDLIFASDFLNLPDFLALTRKRWADVPAVLYFHENQLAYPNQDSHVLDPAYPQANLSGAAAADAVWFNSPHHMEAFFEGLDRLMHMCPDFAPKHLVRDIEAKAKMVPLGVDLAGLQNAAPQDKQGPLTILWNHRWEHDKNPEEVFSLLFDLDGLDVEFELIIAGQRFNSVPRIIGQAHTTLARRTRHWGFVPDRDAYAELLAGADVVVSLAHHDFFGVSVVEAMAMGAMPLLADRVSYPNLIPPEHHADCLVDGRAHMLKRLRALCDDPAAARTFDTAAWVAHYDWSVMAPVFDEAFSGV